MVGDEDDGQPSEIRPMTCPGRKTAIVPKFYRPRSPSGREQVALGFKRGERRAAVGNFRDHDGNEDPGLTAQRRAARFKNNKRVVGASGWTVIKCTCQILSDIRYCRRHFPVTALNDLWARSRSEPSAAWS